MPTLVDKDFPDYTLYPVEEADEKWVKLSNPLPNTYYRVDNDEYTVKCLVTILPDGWHIAWDTCSACSNHMKQCKCASGITQPRTVTYFYSKAMNQVHGTPMISTHELYGRPKPTGGELAINRVSHRNIKPPVTTILPTRLRNKTKFDEAMEEGLSVSDIDNLDLGELNKTAETLATTGTNKVRKLTRKSKKG